MNDVPIEMLKRGEPIVVEALLSDAYFGLGYLISKTSQGPQRCQQAVRQHGRDVLGKR